MITFFASNQSMSVGSYRIWVNDLSYYLNFCRITNNITNKANIAVEDNSSVIILAKSDASYLSFFKKACPYKKIGIINLSADSELKPDFVIAGSIEECSSLSHHSNVFLYPLIEKLYQEQQDYKTHKDNDCLRIGFHGSYTHLSKFKHGLCDAINIFSKTNDIELLVLTSNPSYSWIKGKPEGINIITKKWDIKTIKKDLLSCDIGVVPNTTMIPVDKNNMNLSTNEGRYNTDYILRFKNKSNAGRSFVFHQLGIPVISDLTPSNLHIMGDPRCGYIASNVDDWLKSLYYLKDFKHRQYIADNAKKEFDRLYDPISWTTRLYKSLMEIR